MKKRYGILILYILVLLVLFTACKKISFRDDPLPTTPVLPSSTGKPEPTNTGEPNENVTPQPGQDNEAGTDNTGEMVEPTAGSTCTPIPTVPTDIPTPTQKPARLTAEEAKQLLLSRIGTTYHLTEGETIRISGLDYFLFTVSDDEVTYTPQLAVSADSRELFYYYSEDEITALTNFPPDNVEEAGGGESGFTSEDAIALLKRFSAKQLGLSFSLSEYTVMTDEWTTMVNGQECFCINVYEQLEGQKQLVGVYYVATDGSKVYRSEWGEFILIDAI